LSIVKDCDYVFLEDYAFAAKGRVFHIGENGGILKGRLYECDMPVNVLNIKSAKKFATGNGNAKKDEVYRAFYKDTKLNLETILDGKPDKSPISDIADSYILCKYAFEEYEL
jgi:Holliday junction resolvasome RuvABC endonuclease subunit